MPQSGRTHPDRRNSDPAHRPSSGADDSIDQGQATPSSKRYRIVHVDDDSSDHLLLRKLLSRFEAPCFEVVFFKTFSDAYDSLRSESFDVGLIDYQLGSATGLKLVEELGGRLCPTPLVILTGRGDHSIDVEATKAGAFDYLDKNDLSPALLERTIRNVRVQFETEQRLRQSESLLRQAKAEADAASKAKSEFLARMSHDLRTPLNAILGFSEVVRDEVLGPVGNDKYRDYANDIYQSGQLLLSMINEILDLSKIESGTLEPQEDEVVLDELSFAALRLFGPSAQAAGLSLRVELAPDLPILRADRQMVDRMLFNLLSNSIKFTPKGGRILVYAETGEQGIRLIVEDNGVGIAQSDVKRVLEPFGQLSLPSEPTTGFGLGLAIVRSLIELHGGRLAIEEAPESGTRAILAFPEDRILSRQPRN
ncbi:MAG: ATP-binding protein [Kiloniellales bacterium]|nr:ATP-binding protein [Kiloniellales bacterium]